MVKLTIYSLLILLVTLFSAMAVFAGQPREVFLSLDEAVSIALRQNRDVLLKIEDLIKAKEKIKEARADFLPTLDFTASRTNTLDYYRKDVPQTTTQTTLKQYLYKGSKTENTFKANKYKQEVSAALLNKAEMDTSLSVQKAFWTLLFAGEYARLNKGILKNTQAHIDSVNMRLMQGQASGLDASNIEASMAGIKQAYEASINQIEAARGLLNNLLYLDVAVRIKPEGKFAIGGRQMAYDDAFLKAMRGRPEVRQYSFQEMADRKAVEAAKADTRPSIYASWDYYSRSNTSLTFSPGKSWQDYSIIGITVSWPIFDGWQAKAKVEQALVDLRQTQLTKQKLEKDIALELKNAHIAIQNAMSELYSSRKDIVFYKDNLLSARGKYKKGIASGLDVSDAALKYRVAFFNRTQAVYDYIIAKSEFDKATGEVI